MLVYGGRNGWFGPTLEDAGLQVIFATPGIIMATVFVALPLVIREVVPVLEEIGIEQEQAATSLGANALADASGASRCPPSSGRVVYGVVLSLARSLGEFGAVKVVSGNVLGADPHRHAGRRGEVPQLRPAAAPTPPPSCWRWSSVACIVVVAIIRPKKDRPVTHTRGTDR